jgi:hypothetical protein
VCVAVADAETVYEGEDECEPETVTETECVSLGDVDSELDTV